MRLLLIFALCLVSYAYANEKKDWWKDQPIYDIFVWSFKDSNGDGVGDLNGIISKLDYLSSIGKPIIKLSPIQSSPEEISNSYGVDDFKKIHPSIGNLEDFDKLVNAAQERGIKIILDIVFNHCHIEHEWFKKSENKEGIYTDYFIWKDSKSNSLNKIEPPNAWKSKNDRVAWEWSLKRKQFFYFYFNQFSPDLNLRNKHVKNEIKQIMQFWFDRGVSGLNLLGAEAYLEDQSLSESTGQTDYIDSFDFIRELREFVDIYNKNNKDYDRILMTDGRPDNEITLKYIGNKEYPLVHMVTNKLFTTDINYSLKAQDLDSKLSSIISLIENGADIGWQSENTEVPRISKRINRQYANIVITLCFLLPGTPYIYYGQELGMTDYQPFTERIISEKLRYTNEHALPMQWDNTINAGFSSHEFPLQRPNPDYWEINAEKQRREKYSTYNFVRNLINLRKRTAFRQGDFKSYIISDWIYGFKRTTEEHAVFFTIINLGNTPKIIDLPQFMDKMPTFVPVFAASPNSVYQKRDKINTKSRIVLRPLSSMVVGVMKKFNNVQTEESAEE